jgi:hypothetical protein
MNQALVLPLTLVSFLGIFAAALGIYGTWYEMWGPGAKTCEPDDAGHFVMFIPTGIALALLPLAFRLLG